MRFSPQLLWLLLALSPATIAAAAESFLAAMPASVQTESGVARLSAEQRSGLDALIQRDVDAARAGDVVAFARSFTQRRTPDELERSGVSLLSDAERTKLDEAVATAIAARPPAQPTGFTWSPTSARILRERDKLIVHGELSLFYGQGRGDHSWYGGSFDTWVTDPKRRMTLGVGYAQVREKGAPDYWHWRRK